MDEQVILALKQLEKTANDFSESCEEFKEAVKELKKALNKEESEQDFLYD